MKKIIITLYLLIFILTQAVQAQPTVQDCLGAIPVCLNTYSQTNGYTGVGTVSDIPANNCPITCMTAGERNSVWYTFTVQNTGWFDFRIIPYIGSDDYDWALFNLTTDNCSSLSNTSLLPTLEVSCNWSADGGTTGANSLTPSTGSTCWDASAGANNPRVWVTVGSTYYLNISNYTGYGAGHGYQLDMTNGTAVIFDNVRPYLLPIANPACGTTSLSITMSENVLCSSVSASDFTIAGQTVTAVSGSTCAAGGTMENTYVLTLSPGLSPGTHTVCINGSAGHIADLCGNLTDPANPNNCRTITVPGVVTTVSASPTTVCAGVSTTLTAAGATSYSWSNGLGTGNPVTTSPATSTTYTVTGTNGGCTSSASAAITVSAGPPVLISYSVNPICAGSSTTLTASGATSYTWSGGLGTTAAISVSPATTTTYTVTGNTAGCTASTTFIVNVNPLPNVSITASPNPICAGGSSTLTAAGGTTYSWSSGLGTGNPVTVSPLVNTIYSVTGTSAGCTGSANITVTVGSTIGVTITPSPATICPGASSTLTAAGGATYSWSGGLGTGNPVTVTPASTTTYSVTGTSAAGCTGSTTAIVSLSTNPTVSATATPATICQGGSSSLSGSGASTYTWSGGLAAGSPVTAGPATTTTYTVTGTSAAGCTGTGSVTLNVAPVTANAGSDVIQGACASSTNALNGTGTGTAPLSYSWLPTTGLSNPAIANPVADPSVTTTYTLTVTNGTGCTATDNILVTVNTVTANAGANGNTGACPSSTYNLSGSSTGIAPITYTWTPGTGLSNPSIANPVADPAATTNYTLTVSDTYGCTASDAATVNVSPLPTANAGTDATIGACASALNASLSGSGTGAAPLSYSWSPVTGLSNPLVANPTADPAATTTYALTITDNYGCTATDAVVVTVAPMPTAAAGTDATVGACATAPNVTLSGSGTGTALLTYAWLPTTGLSNPAITTPVADPSATTTYVITVTDTYGCTATDNVTITLDPLPTANAGSDGSIGACSLAGYNISGSGTGTATLTYGWLPSTGLSNAAIANPVATPPSTTTYTLTVSDAYGCTATDNVVVNAISGPAANAGADGTIGTCPSSTYTIAGTASGTAPLSVIWSPATGLSNTSITTPIAKPATTTNYTLTVTDTYGCTASDVVIVNVVPLPAIGVTPSNPTICVGGNVNLTASGGTSYTWTPATGLSATTGASVNAAPAATTNYTVTGSDIYGCTNTAVATVTVNPLPVISINPTATSMCIGSSVLLTASGASGYTWSPAGGLSATSGAAVTANPGTTLTYTVTGTTSGCVGTGSVTVTINSLPTVTFGALPNICANGASINLTTGSPAGGIYSGSGITGSSLNPATAGAGSHTLTYTYTDINNCISSATQNISVIAPPVLSVTPATPSVCIGGSVVLAASGAITYDWYPPTGLSDTVGSTVTASPVTATTYVVTGTAQGCTNSTSVLVSMYTIDVQIVPDNVSICPGGYTVLTAIGASVFNWTPPDGLSSTTASSVSANPEMTTTYVVTGVDNAGCIGTATSTVTIYPSVLMNFIARPTSGCPPLIVDFTFVPSPLVEDSSWSWDFGDAASGSANNSVELMPSHTYNDQNDYIVTLSGVTTDGCIIGSTDTITVFPSPTADFIANPETVTTENPEIDFFDQSYGANFWHWNFGDPGSDDFNFSSQQYPSHNYADSGNHPVILIVTNDYGCSDTIVKYINVIDAFAFFIPNAFTPNDDILNSVFIPKGVGFKVETFEMWIFDRWGKKLFYTTDLYEGWNGINPRTGNIYSQGVYTYIITLRDETNLKREYHGSITLIR